MDSRIQDKVSACIEQFIVTPALATKVADYFSLLHAKDTQFFKQLASGERVEGRLFFVLTIDGETIPYMDTLIGLVNLNSNEGEKKKGKNKEKKKKAVDPVLSNITAILSDIQPELNVYNVFIVKKLVEKIYDQIITRQPAVFARITKELDDNKSATLAEILSCAITYKIIAEAADPLIKKNLALKDTLKLVSDILNAPGCNDVVLAITQERYVQKIKKDLNDRFKCLVGYIENNNKALFEKTLSGFKEFLNNIENSTEYRLLGDGVNRAVLEKEVQKVTANLENIDCKKELTEEQKELREIALKTINRTASDCNLSLSSRCLPRNNSFSDSTRRLITRLGDSPRSNDSASITTLSSSNGTPRSGTTPRSPSLTRKDVPAITLLESSLDKREKRRSVSLSSSILRVMMFNDANTDSNKEEASLSVSSKSVSMLSLPSRPLRSSSS